MKKRHDCRAVIILGSSRSNGETKKVVSELIRISKWDLIDLKDYNISHFDYEHANRNDDFIGLVKHIANSYDTLIFATPVYWYSMSGIMKVFFDRISDFLTIEKDLGRKLRGKNMGVISCSGGNNLEDNFWLPFKKSADYLGMHYLADLNTYQGNLQVDKIAAFRAAVVNGTSRNAV